MTVDHETECARVRSRPYSYLGPRGPSIRIHDRITNTGWGDSFIQGGRVPAVVLSSGTLSGNCFAAIYMSRYLPIKDKRAHQVIITHFEHSLKPKTPRASRRFKSVAICLWEYTTPNQMDGMLAMFWGGFWKGFRLLTEAAVSKLRLRDPLPYGYMYSLLYLTRSSFDIHVSISKNNRWRVRDIDANNRIKVPGNLIFR